MEQKIWYIKKTGGLFSSLSEEEHEWLAEISKMVTCRRKHQFYLSDELSDKIYLVKEGKVRLGRVNQDGDEITLDVLGPGEIFGELALTDEQQRSHFAEATEDSLVCIFPRDKFQKFLVEHQELTFKVMKLIGFRLREMESRLQDLTYQSVAERVRTALIRLAEKHGIPEAGGKVRLSITQKDIAYLVGATRESVAEELGLLKRAGLVETSYRSLLLPNLETLRQ
ncbi:MAG: Crp/Fnr family transcriptional regulator [Desulfuromusa sp.]|jgi:CRP-like cAMP-binding protein|nr:Crp/Fnr family transcriptional regulator [Desulfuromusa sp.]